MGDLPLSDFLAQVLQAIAGFGSMGTLVKVSAVITLIVSTMKVSFFNSLVWSRLGPFKVLVAPALALIGGVIGLYGAGTPITLPVVFSYLVVGTGAVFLHQVLDAVQTLPFAGPLIKSVIAIVEKVLGGPGSKGPSLVK